MLNDSLAAGFRASQVALQVNLKGVTHEQSLEAPAAGGNCLNWIAGHILAARRTILARLGEPAAGDGEELAAYRRGSQGLSAGDPCLPLDKLLAELKASGERIAALLEALDPAALEEPLEVAGVPGAPQKPTVGSFLTFLLFHESYHVGQLGLGRRLLGQPGAIA